MLSLDLARLERVSDEQLEGSIPEDSPLWADTGLRFRGPVSMRAKANALSGGEVLVQGDVSGVRIAECRRCLDEVERPFERSFTFYYVPATTEEGADAEVRFLPESGVELDLGPDVREELIFALSEYVVCRDDCQGLCPRCGIDRNDGTCDCETSEPDPRWEALRTIQD